MTVTLLLVSGAAEIACSLRNRARQVEIGSTEHGSAQYLQRSPLSGVSSPATNQSGTKKDSVDSSNWKKLSNRYGWSLRYPNSWEAHGHEDEAARSDVEPYIQGPQGCYEQSQECGYLSVGIWFGSVSPNAKTQSLSDLNAKEFLLATEFPVPPDPNRAMLEAGDLTVDGVPGYYIVFRQKNFEAYPNGIIMKRVEIKYHGKFYGIAYYEAGKNKAFISQINSPSEWRLNPIFEQIVSSIKFVP